MLGREGSNKEVAVFGVQLIVLNLERINLAKVTEMKGQAKGI